MTGLLRAEILRLRSRRAARWLGLAAIVLIVVVQGVAFAKAGKHPQYPPGSPTTEELRAQLIASCRLDQQGAPPDADCVKYASGVSAPGDHRYEAGRLLPDVARAVGVGVAILGFVVGASSIGAEWSAGTMQALLFWEPRRARVVLAKAAALVTVLLAFLAVAEVVGIATTVLNGALRGTTYGLTGGLWQSTLLGVGRCAGLVTFTGLVGFARGPRPGWVRFVIGDNASALVTNGADVPAAHVTPGYGRGLYRLTGQRAALTLAIYLVVLVGAFVVSFQRRDVT